ncbi:hypothetical protein BaRGS_00040317, partial [Batillaria attramentaria]
YLKLERRSDDPSPLQAVVDQLTQRLSALEASDTGLSGYLDFSPLDEPTHSNQRIESHHVTFSHPFRTVPVVMLGITYLDARTQSSVR